MKKILFLSSTVVLGICALLILDLLDISRFQRISEKSLFNKNDDRTATLIFAGDMMFDRYIRKKADELGYSHILDQMSTLLRDADLVIANLEGPITSNPSRHANLSENNPDHYVFTFNPRVTNLLKKNNISIVSLGNNHISNFGIEGQSETKSFLETADVDFFGLPNDSQYTTRVINGIPVAFVSYNQFSSDNIFETSDLIRTLEEQRYFVIVFSHWGNEYSHTPTENQKKAARMFVDAGAKIVMGAHPHVIQQKEVYKGIPIYYSLGNFVFDQYFSDAVRCGLLLKITITEQNVSAIEEMGSRLEENGSTVPSSCHTQFI